MLNLGRYVNDAYKSSFENNMRYGNLLRDPFGRPPCVIMSSRRKIKAGEELFASYGKRYWASWNHLVEDHYDDDDDIDHNGESMETGIQ